MSAPIPPMPEQTSRFEFLRRGAVRLLGLGLAALVVFGLALSLALPWRSTLDHVPPPSTTAASKPGAASSPGAAASGTTPAASTAPAPAPASRTPFASREERARHWPSFRGPASGHTAATLPTEWEGRSGKGVGWKTPLPLPGFGSPILWGDRIFLSGANAQERAVYCVDARDGKVVWTKPVSGGASPGEAPRVLGDTGYAAPTLATDGHRVFALFATGDLAAFDFEGTPVWTRSLGVPDNPYGQGSSLEVYEDAVIVQYDQKKNAFLGAFDTATGNPRWKLPRDVGASWASPSVVEVGGQPRLVLVADAFLTLHDPRDGQELWRVQWGRAGDVATSPLFANGLFYAACDHVKFAAIDGESHKVAWENTTEIPGVSTPVAVGPFLFGGQSEGGIVCWEARTGKKLWLQETDEGFYASPLAAGNRVYLLEQAERCSCSRRMAPPTSRCRSRCWARKPRQRRPCTATASLFAAPKPCFASDHEHPCIPCRGEGPRARSERARRGLVGGRCDGRGDWP